jgi:hypothetical protein
MPYTEVMHKFGKGQLHSGSKGGPEVKNRKQAIAIMMSEKRAAAGGKEEYKPESLKALHRRGKK